MPVQLKTKVETDAHNQAEFARQKMAFRQRTAAAVAQRHARPRIAVIPRERLTIQPAPSRAIAAIRDVAEEENENPIDTLGESIDTAGAQSLALSRGQVERIEAIVPWNAQWIQEAIRAAAAMPSPATEVDEPVYTLTRHQLAGLIDGGVKFANFQRDMESWFREQKDAGSYDVRLNDYSFRCAEFRRQLANGRSMAMPQRAIEVAGPSGVVAPIQKRAKLTVPDGMILRIRIEGMKNVAVWHNVDEVDALDTKPRDMGAGIRVAQNGKFTVDFTGAPVGLSTVTLEFEYRQIKLTVAPGYLVLDGRYLLTESGMVELVSFEKRDPDWMLQFLDIDETTRFALRYGNKYFDVEWTVEEGVRVVVRQ